MKLPFNAWSGFLGEALFWFAILIVVLWTLGKLVSLA